MLRQYLKSLADEFRVQLGMEDSETINAQDYIYAIEEVYQKGFRDGVSGGGSSGDISMYNITNNGTRTVYTYGFSYCNLEGVSFTQDIKPTSANSMFANSVGNVDLSTAFSKNGKSLDFSNCTDANRCFYSSEVNRIGFCDLTKMTNLTGFFGNCDNLQKIDGVKFSKDKAYTLSNMFINDRKLTDVTASGELATDGLDLSACPLTKESKKSFFKILVETSVKKMIVFGAGEAIPDDDKDLLEALEKGWSVTV